MRKTLAAVLTASAVLCVYATASAAPAPVNGSFTQAFMKPNQLHRMHFAVTAGRGAKTCQVTLAGKTVEVSLGTDKESQLTHIFYLRPRITKIALSQAVNAPSPTSRIICTH